MPDCPSQPTALPRIIFGLTAGTLSGVDVFIGRLAGRLAEMGRQVEVLLSEHDVPSDQYIPLEFPQGLSVSRLAVTRQSSWKVRWRAMQDYLEAQAPCIYVTNYDWNHACAAPCCSAAVRIVGVLHSDEADYYKHFGRQGAWWDRTVAVSKAILQKASTMNPGLADRLVRIPYGVETVEPVRRKADGPLKVLYAGRMVQKQKNAGLLKDIILESDPENVMFSLAGDGPARGELEQALRGQGNVSFLGKLRPDEMLQQYIEHDAVILVSSYEGLPLCLLEGMAAGCVPVVPDIESGIPELLENGRNGCVVKAGSTKVFVDTLHHLAQDMEMQNRLSRSAVETIRDRFSIDRCAAEYDRLFQEVAAAPVQREAPRIVPPRNVFFGIWKHRLSRLWPFP